jgi:hypothetical protein
LRRKGRKTRRPGRSSNNGHLPKGLHSRRNGPPGYNNDLRNSVRNNNVRRSRSAL